MFIQVIVGKTSDPSAVKAANERWQKELRPGAKGFLGGTSGVADDGTVAMVIRFESEADAQANSERPEQGKFFEETSGSMEGTPTFYNCPEAELFGKGGSDEAGFVQLMIYKPKDVAAHKALNEKYPFETFIAQRPEILGGTTGYATDGTVIDTTYFTSEAAAREGEKQDMPADVQQMMQEFGANAGEIRFIDLRDPWFS
jgi:hypothetical protein